MQELVHPSHSRIPVINLHDHLTFCWWLQMAWFHRVCPHTVQQPKESPPLPWLVFYFAAKGFQWKVSLGRPMRLFRGTRGYVSWCRYNRTVERVWSVNGQGTTNKFVDKRSGRNKLGALQKKMCRIVTRTTMVLSSNVRLPKGTKQIDWG